MLRSFFSFLAFLLLLSGCAQKSAIKQGNEVVVLAQMLHALNTNNAKEAAQQLAYDIFDKTEQLVKEFEFISPPQFHNFLVNVGVKEKGLCYHWSDALYDYLNAKHYEGFEFHLFGANIGEYWSEHNVLVVSAKGGVIEEGVIIDPWRDPGRLFFSKVEEDSAYRWKHRSDRGCQSTLKR
jgi:hypothetical protein